MAFRVLHTSDFTLERIRRRDMLLIDSHSGAYAYGLTNTISARNSFRGVFVAPNTFLLGMEEITYVSDPKTDQIYYEIKRFLELLMMNNPLVMEMLNMPTDSIRYRNGLFGLIKPEIFISKLCSRTYTEFALEQLNRIQRQNAQLAYKPEKIAKKEFSDFCYFSTHKGNIPVLKWLEKMEFNLEDCGLSPVPHTRDIYRIYAEKGIGYKGIFIGDAHSPRLVMSDIPPGKTPVGHLIFDEKEFTAYSRELREQKEREEQRKRLFQEQKSNSNYNAPMFMEIVRLLSMARDIAKEGLIVTRRPDAPELLKIRSGTYSFDYLRDMVQNMVGDVLQAFRNTQLQPAPNKDKVQQVLLEIRARFGEKPTT